MKRQKGFTLIDFAICAFILALIISFGFVLINSSNGDLSVGLNGITETRCINGYSFVIGEGGQARQIMDEFGRGVKCL